MTGKQKIQKERKAFSVHSCPYIVMFFLLWLFSGWIYGDVFYISQQHTYFAFDTLLLKEVTIFWYGWAIVIGRFILLAFHYPIIGGCVYAAVLTLIAYLINYIFKCRGYASLIGIAVPFAWLFFLISLRLNLFYRYETSFFVYIPVLLLLLLAVVSTGIRIWTKRKFPAIVLDKTESVKPQWLSTLTVAALFAGLYCYAWMFNENTIITTRLQRQLQNYQWEDMKETARKATRPTRPICAYYATALGYLNQLDEHLFDVYFQYPASHLVNRNEYDDIGTFYYAADLYLYMGLANPSWHRNIDHLTMEGLSAYNLKNLCRTAIVNNELIAAEKIMYIIEQMPFEGDFVEKYKPMIYDRNLMKNDPVLSRTEQLLPRLNAFEQEFFVPLFLGYYVDGGDGLPKGTEPISMAASLYTKQLDKFAYYFYKNRPVGNIPSMYEEALLLFERKNSGKVTRERYSPYVYDGVRQLGLDARELPKDEKVRGRELRDKYLGMYSMYYLYQNIPDENYPEPKPEEKDAYNKVN